MHLCELPYFQALSWDRLGNPVKGQALINKFLHKWQNECRKENNGYFKTTPFFISYCEDPISARTAHYSYLIGLANLYLNNTNYAEENLRTSLRLEPDNLYCRLELELLNTNTIK